MERIAPKSKLKETQALVKVKTEDGVKEQDRHKKA